jgi:hypothetical protein
MIPIELIILAGCIASGVLGFLAAAALSSRHMARAYRAGRRDMEKLIRDRHVMDLRDRTSARL